MDHGQHANTTNLKALKISAVLIFIYFIFEIAVALFTGSLSLLADAGHELSTFIAIGISLIAMRLASTPPTAKRTFGLLRIEVLAALINGLLLLAMAVFIIIQGIDRINHPVEVPSLPMFIMAIGGIGLEIASLIIMYKGQKSDLNIRGSFWHVVNAFLGSLAVIIAAMFIQFGEIYAADAWAGIFFAVILTYAAYGIIKDSVRILIDATPADVDMPALARDLKKISGVKDAHHFHARTITSQMKVFSGHLVVNDLKQADRILKKAKDITDRKYKFNLSTIQLEKEGLSESDPKPLEAEI
jgi:cobalt-zinc-cadmium efflux system protein